MSRPAPAASRGEPGALLGPLALVLICLVLLANPELVILLAISLLPLWLPLLLLLWLLGRIGLLGPLMILRPRRTPRTRDVPPTLAFRIDDGGTQREVRLLGHDSGVREQDIVRLVGFRRGGVLHPALVVNETAGSRLWRAGLARTALLLLLDAWLLLSLLASCSSTSSVGGPT